MPEATQQFNGPGFVAVFFDIPFPISIPNGTYRAYDPRKRVACVTVTLREGSRAFFRNRPLIGPSSFQDLKTAAHELERPREDYSYIQTNHLVTGEQKATLNIHTGLDGGYVECKYYSEVCVTYLEDDIALMGNGLIRACEILNPFLDKYRLMNENYRVEPISLERNFYFATCHTSPLATDEINLQPLELFNRLQKPRTFYKTVGRGALNILRTNSFELLGPRSPLAGQALDVFAQFIQEEYEMPLSYALIMEALGYLQRFREYRLAIVQAETAFEVYVIDRLVRLMVDSGMNEAHASSIVENDKNYWGVKNKIRRLDDLTATYVTKKGLPFVPFFGSPLFARWESELYSKRNDAVHTGASSFSYNEASVAIGVAKECIVTLEGRIPGLSDRVQLNPSMKGFRQNAGEVSF
jgi:hypothetical protein